MKPMMRSAEGVVFSQAVNSRRSSQTPASQIDE